VATDVALSGISLVVGSTTVVATTVVSAADDAGAELAGADVAEADDAGAEVPAAVVSEDAPVACGGPSSPHAVINSAAVTVTPIVQGRRAVTGYRPGLDCMIPPSAKTVVAVR
jgi:ABC-type taurine transport system substrate-binding protein